MSPDALLGPQAMSRAEPCALSMSCLVSIGRPKANKKETKIKGSRVVMAAIIRAEKKREKLEVK